MPRFFFDLFLDRCVVLDPGGMTLASRVGVSVATGELARHLYKSRAELRETGSWIRVRDHRGKEVYRLAIDPPQTASSRAGV